MKTETTNYVTKDGKTVKVKPEEKMESAAKTADNKKTKKEDDKSDSEQGVI